MTLTGHNVYSDLRRRVNDARSRARETELRLHQLRIETQELVADRGQAITDLARAMLPEITHDAIDNTVRGIRDDLRDILDRRDNRIDQIHDSLDELLAQRDRIENELEDVLTQLETETAERDRLEALIAEELEQSTEFQRLSKEAAHVEDNLERNEERVAEIRREAEKKLPAYESNRLFTYLLGRQFGTSDYTVSGMTKRLDRWVARIVNYEDNKPSYDFLKVTPELVAAELERRQEDFDALMDRVESIRDAAAEKAGLPPVADRVESLEAERDGFTTALDQSRTREEGYETELESIENSEGRYYAEAIARFRDFLSEQRTKHLARQAERTEDETDDEIVREIRSIDRRLDDVDENLEDAERDHKRAERQARELDSLMSRFRRSGYHSAQSAFPRRDPRDVLDDYERGRADSGDVWNAFERGHESLMDTLGGVAEGLGDLMRSPATRVLFRAMGNAVGDALSGAIGRGMGRRGGLFGSGKSRKRGRSAGRKPSKPRFSIGDRF